MSLVDYDENSDEEDDAEPDQSAKRPRLSNNDWALEWDKVGDSQFPPSTLSLLYKTASWMYKL